MDGITERTLNDTARDVRIPRRRAYPIAYDSARKFYLQTDAHYGNITREPRVYMQSLFLLYGQDAASFCCWPAIVDKTGEKIYSAIESSINSNAYKVRPSNQ